MGHLHDIAIDGEAAGELCRGECLEVSRPGQPDVQRLEPLGGPEQQRGSVATAVLGVRDLCAQQVHAGAAELIEQPCIRRGQQLQGHVGRAGQVSCMRGRQRAARATRRIGPKTSHSPWRPRNIEAGCRSAMRVVHS